MFFIPRGNKLYAKLIQVSPFWRYCFTFIALFLISGCWFFFMHAAISERTAQLQADLADCCQHKKRCSIAQKKCITMHKMIQSQEIKIKKLANEIGHTNSVKYIDHILSLIANHSLQLVSCSIDDKQAEAPSISLRTQGSWDHIQLFVADLLQKEQPITIQDIILQKNDTQFSITATILLHTILA